MATVNDALSNEQALFVEDTKEFICSGISATCIHN